MFDAKPILKIEKMYIMLMFSSSQGTIVVILSLYKHFYSVSDLRVYFMLELFNITKSSNLMYSLSKETRVYEMWHGRCINKRDPNICLKSN